MATAQQPQHGPSIDRYVVMQIWTTCDQHAVYVQRDMAEVIEIGWILLDAKSLEEIARESVIVRPANTPITPLCTSLTTLTWEHVRNAGDFRSAIQRFDQFYQEYIARDNLSFAFVTLDSWDLRVQLPREARDKAVVLPLYLQHSRTFELRTEYQRWQAYHPESLPFGSSALTNICAALEVEAVQVSAPIKHGLPFHLQALASASPRRAMEEAVTLTRVLCGLIRKSQPLSEHPDVLSRPMDANADVRAFLAERSKVLHMSGLPHDTTQSELESWYTQFGGRPIAFWTLRTPDQHKPTGTGFAIFSSHEEAAESLCMNGRALNERAIEVSPSSAQVLDRAHEILTPFPPSKNRPRPGDWNCPQCGFSNFQRRTACFRCSYPAMQAAHGGDPMGFGYGYPPHAMMGGHPHMSHSGHGGHGSHNMPHMGRAGGGPVPFRAGDWKCGQEGCSYHNFAKNISCLRCSAPRSSAAIINEPSFTNPMDNSSNYGMHASSMAGTPGIGPYGQGHAGYASGGGYNGHQYGGPPSTYALPSGPGGGLSPYPSMGAAAHYNQHTVSGAPSAGGVFDGRAESTFSGAGQTPASAGSAQNGNNYGFEAHNDPFAFLSAGMGNLIMDDGRRNGAVNSTKSPA